MRVRYRMLAASLLMVAVAVAAASVASAQTPPPQTPPPNPMSLVHQVPFLQQWAASGHADAKSMAFNDWNDAQPPAVPVDCARCHSTPGYLDYLGADGSPAKTVDKPAAIGTVVECIACHNEPAIVLKSVTFPSGVERAALETSNRCAVCHQGRASKASVDQAISRANVPDADTPSQAIRFVNIHYFAAAATLYGSEVKGGYEYDNMAYQPRFRHVEGYDQCANCHNPHGLEVKVGECAACHAGVKSQADLRNIRTFGSLVDYDGDGHATEGIALEIEHLQQKLMSTMQNYARQLSKPVAYSAEAYPYYFNDLNGNGKVDADEAVAANAYNGFTARLAKAAYNYQVSIKDPGAYAHNAKYIIQLLRDSLEDLSLKLGQPTGLGEAQRDDAGHFAGTHEAWRHWDADGTVPADCVRCHTDSGLPFFLKNGVTIAMQPSESMKCSTCHQNMQDFALLQTSAAPFPSGARLSFSDNPQSNLCLDCHQGRESKVSVDAAIQRANVGPNDVSPQLNFRNPHYFAAGATLFGTEAKGAYEFDGKEYAGRFTHVANYDSCAECHDPHMLNVRADQCSSCHPGVQTRDDTFNIRLTSTADYDGDGNATEGIAFEISTMQEGLYAAIQGYASGTLGVPIAYSALSYPYWFQDTNGNGQVDADEAVASNSYPNWSPTLLRAAYNYQWVTKDPGAFSHNGRYIMQILYDSLQATGGNAAVAGMTRP